MTGLPAELAKIDGNIIRRNPHYSDEGKQLARRKEIYEILHPETRQGQRNRQTLKTDTETVLRTKSFADDTADKTGQAARTVRRKIQVANNLTPEAAPLLADGKIHKVDEYTAAQLEAEQTEAGPDAPPFRLAERQFDTFAAG